MDALPPGIAKNLQRGKPLPPGIAKKNLPEGLESQLPNIGDLKRIIIGKDIALVDEENNVILDVIKDILGN